jgi:hypothetical protein
VKLLDMDWLHVNLSEIEDKDFDGSEKNKKPDKQLYGKLYCKQLIIAMFTSLWY